MVRRSLLALVAALVLVALAMAGCGVTVGHTLNQASAERQISKNLAKEYAITAPTVNCPAGVKATTGRRFDCTTSLDGQPLTLHAVLTDEQGGFTLALGAVVFRTSTAATAFAASVTTRTKIPSKVSCGTRPVLVEHPKKPFHCQVTQHGSVRALTVTVTDLRGHVRWVLGPAPAP